MPESDTDWLPKCPACRTPCAEHVGSPVPKLFRCVCGSCSTAFWVEEVPTDSRELTAAAVTPKAAEAFLSPRLLSVIRRRRRTTRGEGQ